MTPESSLAAGEQPVLLLHPHWKTLIRPVLVAVLVVAVALIAEVLIPSGSAAAAARGAVGIVAVLFLMVWLIVPVLRWRTTTYELTTKRLRTRFGIITRKGRDIPLTRINDVSFEKGLLDRLLGAGRLVVESAGEHGQIVLRDIPDVADVQATLFRLVEDERPYEGDVPVGRVVSVAGRALADGADSASFGDTTGMATPTRVRALVGAFRSAHPDTALNLHFHNTRGAGLANVLAALELGVADFDASVGGLGGCPYAPGATGNIATEELVHMVEDMGVSTGIDLEAMIAAAAQAEGIVGRTLPSQVLRAGPRSRTIAP